MSIEYYLYNKAKQVFQVGSHRHEYAEAIRTCVTEAKSRATKEEFIEACMRPARKHDERVPGYSVWVAKQAPRVWTFMEDNNFDVTLVDDCGDEIHKLDSYKVIHSVYSNFTPYIMSQSTPAVLIERDATLAHDIVNKIILDLRGRSGLDSAWDGIDNDIRREIRFEWIAIVEKCLEQDE